MGDTKIQWCDKTWNPTRGCSRVSPGCVNCYAERQAARFARTESCDVTNGIYTQVGPFAGFVHRVNGHPAWTGKVELIESMLNAPLHWRKPCRVFVNSMSDLFHEALSHKDRARVFTVMQGAPHHTYQILTKRADIMKDFGEWWCKQHTEPRMPGNWWLGVSVEDQQRKDRIDILRETPAAVRFLSIEPLIEDIGVLDLAGISWVIIGGESGPGARRFDLEWMKSIVEQCKAAGVAVFCKQIGSNPYWAGYQLGRAAKGDRKGGDMESWPEFVRVREFPQ